MDLTETFVNKIIDKSENRVVIRSSVRSIDDCNEWVREYGEISNTHWNARTSVPNGKKMVCSKKFVCHHSAFNKLSSGENKRGVSKNSNCPATISLRVKLENGLTKRRDCFIQEGLPGIITINEAHNHSINTAESLRFLPAYNADSRESFLGYFNDGMTVAEACHYHECILQLKEGFNETQLANSRINPTSRAVHYWYEQWRNANLFPRNGIEMIEEENDGPLTSAVQQDLQPPPLINPGSSLNEDCTKTNNENDEEMEILRKQFANKIVGIVGKYNSSKSAIQKAIARLDEITSEEQCETMLHTLGRNIPLRRKAGAAIRVQPTSIARRSAAVTRGSKRLASGRPAKGHLTSKKRRHNLSFNVLNNQSNAKKH